MKVLIVDDEFNSRRIIRKFLSDAFPELVFLNDASNVQEAVSIINDENPELLLLDIQLKGDLSFDIFNSISLDKRQVIFITAYEQYALRAFDYGASNYLLKPIERSKLINAVQRVMDFIGSQIDSISGESISSAGRIDRLLIPAAGNSMVVEVDHLKYAVAEGVYCTLHLRDKEILVSKPLSFIEEKLKDHSDFFRIHKSYLINLKFVQSLSNDGKMLTISDSIVLPVSRAKNSELRKLIKERFY